MNKQPINPKKENTMEKKKEPLFVALSNQKGGVGKSTLTILLASYFHYRKGKNVLVVDCDYPQHSIRDIREWDIKTVEKNGKLQERLLEQFEGSDRKAYTVLTSTPEDAKQAAYEFLDRSETAYDLVLTDLPGTVNAAGVFRSLVNMDYLFVPVTQNRMVMQISMNFVLAIRELLSRNDSFPLKDIRLFWNCMDRRVSKELYRAYTEIFRHLELKTLETVLPKAERFNRGICTDGQVFRSTLFPPSPSLLKGSHIDLLADELETILGLTE